MADLGSSIAAAAATGDRLATLEAMRAKLAADMDEAPPAVVAQVAGRLSAVLLEIEALAGKGARTTLDELRARRENRESAPDVVGPPKGRAKVKPGSRGRGVGSPGRASA